MSEQALDFQSVLSTMRRHRMLLAGLTLAGGLAGAALVHVHPPMYASTAQVYLPDPPDAGAGAARDPATDMKVALSDVVLEPASTKVMPHLTVTEVLQRVTVSSGSANVLNFKAKAPTAQEAEDLVGAVAQSEVDYLSAPTSSLTGSEQQGLDDRNNALQGQIDDIATQIKATRARMGRESKDSDRWHADAVAVAELTAQRGHLAQQVELLKEQLVPTNAGSPAKVITSPTPAKRSNLVLWTAFGIVFGGLVALGLSTLVLSILSRRDRRLRTRDEVADALGSAVIGSVRTRPQRAAAGWSALMEKYQPSVTEAWSLRQALDHVGLGDLTVRSGPQGGNKGARPRILTVVSLSDDPRGLAVGPQLASHAASLGLQTRLVAKQGHESSTALWAACSALRRDEQIRPGLYVDTRRRRGDDLTVEVVVVDRRVPQFVSLDSSAVTLLAVASSSATAEDLAGTAVAAYEAGGRISGVIIADPDSLDHTTGRLLFQQRSEQMPLPTRMTGLDPTANGEASEGSGR
jgi:capsular polysaccharide biosynthesis protein